MAFSIFSHDESLSSKSEEKELSHEFGFMSNYMEDVPRWGICSTGQLDLAVVV